MTKLVLGAAKIIAATLPASGVNDVQPPKQFSKAIRGYGSA
ncbi:hypothetical protein [Ruegeria arenilitoris]|nr:hypothetical protein [Ruegeria arenilitoris]